MWKEPDWDDGNYMEWADQERLVRQDLEEIREMKKEEAKKHVTDIQDRREHMKEV